MHGKVTVLILCEVSRGINLSSMDTDFGLLFSNTQLGTAVKLEIVLLTSCEQFRVTQNDTKIPSEQSKTFCFCIFQPLLHSQHEFSGFSKSGGSFNPYYARGSL